MKHLNKKLLIIFVVFLLLPVVSYISLNASINQSNVDSIDQETLATTAWDANGTAICTVLN